MDDRNWLADELQAHRKGRKWVFIKSAIAIGLIGLATFLLFYPDHHSKSVSLTANQSSGQDSGLQASGSTTTPTSNSKQAAPPSTSSQPTTNNKTSAQNPVVSTPPSSVQVNCSLKDSQYLAPYDTWASGIFSDLRNFENQIISNGGTVSQINNNIETVNSQSEQNYNTYVSDDGQYNCLASLGSPYLVPICTNITQCVSEIPSVP